MTLVLLFNQQTTETAGGGGVEPQGGGTPEPTPTLAGRRLRRRGWPGWIITQVLPFLYL